MKNNKISTNIFYNVLNQVVSLVVPLIISPYIARVLSAELIGDYSFALANSSYFVLIETLGLPLYGMLKVSANRNDKECISALYIEIMLAKLMLMIICIFAYILLFIVFFNVNKELCLIMILNIFSAGIDSTWFLTGVEDFKTTTIRNIIVRIVSVFLILLFVKSQNDLLVYALIMQSSNAFSYIIICPVVKKYIMLVKPAYSRIIQHIKKSLIYFIPGIVNTVFTYADKTVLGAFANSYEVGVYEQSTKITSLCGSVINSVSSVLLPRVTYLNYNSNKEESKKFLLKSLGYAFLVSSAVSAGIACISVEFVPVFFGPGYEKSSVLLKILSVNVVMTVLANYMGQQCLVSNNSQREYNFAIVVGSVINLVMNMLLVNTLQSVGVSLASSFSSIVVFVLVLYFSKKIISINDVIKMTWKSTIAVLVMIMTVIIVKTDSNTLTIILKVIIGSLSYFATLLVLREKMIMDIFFALKNRR